MRYRFYRAISSIRHWIERRFTRAGLLVLGSTLFTGVIALDMENTVAYQATAWLVALLGVSMIASLSFRARFHVGRTLPRYGSVGQALVYRVHVRNRTRRMLRNLEIVEDLADPRPTLSEFIARQKARGRWGWFRPVTRQFLSTRPARVNFSPLPALAAHGETDAPVELIPQKRGLLRFEGVTVGRCDPFGLFRGVVRVPLPQTVIVLPRRYPLPPIALPGKSQFQQGGVAMASSIGESEEFVSLRDYRPGDPLRRVHWRSWARTGRLIVKEYQDEFFVRHALVLDTFAGPERAVELEEAISVAASFACTVTTQESLLDLMFIGPQAICFTTGRGVAHAEQALEVLSAVQPCREKPFRALHDLVLHHAAAVSGCICILIDWDEARRELVRRVTMTGVPVLTLLVATGENAVKFKTDPTLARFENLRILEVGKIAQGLQTLEPFSVAAA
jgi:uncharacterized protein (DUF58 family)